MYSLKNIKFIAVLLTLGMLNAACDSTEPGDGPGEEELITKVTVTLTAGSAAPIVVVASDPDGDGSDFTIGDLNLDTNTTYSGEIKFEDTVNNEDITEEVEGEADEHQVHYLPSSALNLTVTATDQDSNELPVGLSFTLTTTDSSTGNLRVVLSHYDDSPKDGTTLSDESDVDINFPVVIDS